MKRTFRPILTAVLCALIATPLFAVSLQEAFEAARPLEGYDKYVILETGEIYTGGLQIGPSLLPRTQTLTGPEGLDVCIDGNGAILDLDGEQLMISYCLNRMDVSDLIVLNGNIRYRGVALDGDKRPIGIVRNVTFHRAHDYGVRLDHGGATAVRKITLVR